MTDRELTPEEDHAVAEVEHLLDRLRANPPMGGFRFELMICEFERDRRAAEKMLGEMMDDQVRTRARFKEQLDAYHTNGSLPRPEGEDRTGEPPPDPPPD